jgi:hypothetical protein
VVPPRCGHQRAALIVFRAGTLAASAFAAGWFRGLSGCRVVTGPGRDAAEHTLSGPPRTLASPWRNTSKSLSCGDRERFRPLRRIAWLLIGVIVSETVCFDFDKAIKPYG